MDRFRDFDAFEAEHRGTPLTFRLGGQEWNTSSVDAFSILLLARQLADGGDGAITAFVDFITRVVDKNQRSAFEAMLAAKRPRLATFVALVQWMVEQETGAPFAAASDSPARPSRRGGRQKAASLSGASTNGHSHSASG